MAGCNVSIRAHVFIFVYGLRLLESLRIQRNPLFRRGWMNAQASG
jgi:hypothetical protein